jgi:hypothetical protein
MTPRAVRIAALVAVTVLLAGCYESHLARRETISPHGGDAMAANRAIMTIDPWPDYAWDKRLIHDGKRLAKRADRYRDPRETPGATTAMPIPMVAAPDAQAQTGQ